MTIPLPFQLMLVAIVLTSFPGRSAWADEPASTPAAAKDALATRSGLDPALVYRFDPLTQALAPIARQALKPDHVYRRHSRELGRWVWSKATGDGELAYAMGPGSVQPAWMFDITATPEERRQALEQRAPEIARLYAVQGARAALVLGADDEWTLQGVSTKGHVFDLMTGCRWEWHGAQRVGVVHLGGNAWQWHDGTLVPSGLPPAWDVHSCLVHPREMTP